MEHRDVFISYIEEDGPTARALAKELRVQGQSTWTYEEDGVAGISYLTQVHRAIESCRVFLLIASAKSVNAHQVIREVEQAHEREKVLIAVRVGLTHQQFVGANPILRMASGTAVTLSATEGNFAETARRIAESIKFGKEDTQPIAEPQPVLLPDAVPVRTAAPLQQRPREERPVAVAVVDSLRPVADPPVEAPDMLAFTSGRPAPKTTQHRLPTSFWLFTVLGMSVQSIAAMAYVVVWSSVLEGLVWAAVVAAVIVGCGVVLARWLIAIRRSLDQGATPPSSFAKAVPLITCIAFPAFLFVESLILWIRYGTSTLGALIDYTLAQSGPYVVIGIFGAGLIWNGLRIFRTRAC